MQPLPSRLLGLILPLVCLASHAAEFHGPLPYHSRADLPSGFATGSVAVEDFEDSRIDPRLITSGVTLIEPGGITDSVDADDGAIDGNGNGGRSLFGSNIRIEFTPPLPESAGMVWTDGAVSNVTFEAFGPDGGSLGSVGPFQLGDGSITGTTAEDRFFGVRDAGGVRAISFSSPAVMEIDHVHYNATTEPAIISTLEDGDLGLLLPTPDANLPGTPLQAFALPAEAAPHGLAFLGPHHVLFADFIQPRLLRAALDNPAEVESIPLPGRSNTNGSLAVEPNGRYALSIGEAFDAGVGEAVVVDFGVDPPAVTPIAGALRVPSFVTAAIDFAPDRRAFVCHSDGVSVLSPPYTEVDFTMAFPPLQLSGSMCRLAQDGSRLFVTRVLSETVASANGVHTTRAPFSVDSSFVTMPAPSDVQGLGPMAVSPDGTALIVGQQFLFPPAFTGTRARAFLLRAPFDVDTAYVEIELPPEVVGAVCEDSESQPRDCPGIEHIEVDAAGSLAVLTGNSTTATPGRPSAVPAIFLRSPFDNSARSAVAVPMVVAGELPGRGTGGVRFQPASLFRDGFEGE